MAKTNKPVIKKTATPAAPAAPIPAPRATRARESVLIKVTASKLRDLIGAETPIGVSRKELKALIVKSKASDVLAEAGL